MDVTEDFAGGVAIVEDTEVTGECSATSGVWGAARPESKGAGRRRLLA